MKDKKDLFFLVTGENRIEFEELYRIIRFYKSKGLLMQPNIAMRVFEILYNKTTYENAQLWDKAEKCAEIALGKLSLIRGYDFSWRPRSIPKSINSLAPDTKFVFTEIIYAFFLAQNDIDKMGKDEAISFFYLALKKEYKMQLLPDHIKNFSTYKQAVVSGILAIGIGFKLTSSASPTKEEIYQATRNAIKNTGKYWE